MRLAQDGWRGLGGSARVGRGIVAGMALFVATTADGTPAHGRRYGVNCETCHAPLPPRLNNVGILFRKSGFRMPDADENGKFLLKTVSSHGWGDAVSIVGNAGIRRDDKVGPGESRTTFELGEVELASGTAIGKHFSTQVMLTWADGVAKVENLEAQVNLGSTEHQFTARGGLLQTYIWQKANHGSLTHSTPLLFDEAAVLGVGGFGGFGLGGNQLGAEVGYVYTHLADGKMSSTIVTAALLNGVNEAGERADRNTRGGADFYLQAVHLFGDRNTIGAFYYDGRTTLDPTGAGDPAGPFRHRFARYGVMGNYLLFKRFDVVGGAALGTDRSEVLGTDARFRGFFGELDIQLTKRLICVYRYDDVDTDRDAENASVRAHTVSTTWQADDHVYLTGEYRWLRRPEGPDVLTNGSFILNARVTF